MPRRVGTIDVRLRTFRRRFVVGAGADDAARTGVAGAIATLAALRVPPVPGRAVVRIGVAIRNTGDADPVVPAEALVAVPIVDAIPKLYAGDPVVRAVVNEEVGWSEALRQVCQVRRR